jgi:hypothetical protein
MDCAAAAGVDPEAEAHASAHAMATAMAEHEPAMERGNVRVIEPAGPTPPRTLSGMHVGRAA